MALETLVAGAAANVAPLNNNFNYLDGRITTVNSTVTTQGTNISNLQSSVSNLQLPSVITLTGTTPSLTDNSEHVITITGNTTFTVPAVSTTDKFHQMLVLAYMPTVYTLNLGTSGKYFKNETPDMSAAGHYTIIYEFDGTAWYVGAIYRG